MLPCQRAITALSFIVFSAPAFADEAALAASVANGRQLFQSNCVACHGVDGKAMVDVVSDATDLTEPDLYRNGTSDDDILRSIREGAGGVMPAFGNTFQNEQDLIDLRNFVKSLSEESAASTGIF